MAKSGSVDYKELQEFSKAFAKTVGEFESGQVFDDALREIGKKHLGRLVRNTPYGVYPSKITFITRRGGDGLPFTFAIKPKRGGTLKKAWVGKSGTGIPTQAEINAKAASVRVIKRGNTRSITFYNRTQYASWVDKGHRLCHPPGAQYGWVAPRNFVLNSEVATESEMPKIIERKMRAALKKRGGRWWR